MQCDTASLKTLFTVSVLPPAVAENGPTDLVYTFTRTVTSGGPQTVNFSVNASATLNTDYTVTGADTFTAVSGTVTFAGTNSTATVTINPSPDTTPEVHETVQLTVTSGSGYFVGSPSTATGTILNDDESVSAGQLIISEFRLSGPEPTRRHGRTTSLSSLHNTTRICLRLLMVRRGGQ